MIAQPIKKARCLPRDRGRSGSSRNSKRLQLPPLPLSPCFVSSLLHLQEQYNRMTDWVGEKLQHSYEYGGNGCVRDAILQNATSKRRTSRAYGASCNMSSRVVGTNLSPSFTSVRPCAEDRPVRSLSSSSTFRRNDCLSRLLGSRQMSP